MITALREWRVGTDASGEAVTPRRRWWFDPSIIALLCAAIAYLAVLALRLPGLLSPYYSYSDFPEVLRLGDAVFHAGYGQGLAVPSQSGIGPLWVVGLLNQVTGSEVAAMALGGLLLLASTAFMVLAARRVLGTGSAVLTGGLCVALPPVVAWQFLNPVAHESTVLMTAVLAWQLVSPPQSRRGSAVASSLLVGLGAGICVVSDPLVLAAAIVPWLLCAALTGSRHRERRAQLATTAAAALASAGVLVWWASTHGIVERSNAGFAATIQGFTDGVRTTALTLGQMFSGSWYGGAFAGALAVGGVVVFGGVVLLASRVFKAEGADQREGTSLYVAFWLLSVIAVVGAFCVSGLGVQRSQINYQGHYVDGLWFAFAALAPVALVRTDALRRTLIVASCCLVTVSAVGVVAMPAYPFDGPDYVDAVHLDATLEQLGVTQGYGGYWESYAVGWHTDQHITALPLQQCVSRSGAPSLCRYEFAAPAWYRQQSGPVFVIVLRGACSGDDLCIGSVNLAGLPPPETTRNVGLLQVDVYAHDVFAGLPMAARP